MSYLYFIRNFIQKYDAKHWQFLLLTIIITIIAAVLSLYGQVGFNVYAFYFILIITSLIQALISYFYMQTKGEASKVFFSLLFALFTFLLSKYMVFEHYFDFFLEAYIDRSTLSLNHIAFYFSAISFESVFYFVKQMPNFISWLDYLVLIIMLLISLLYLYLPFEDKTEVLLNQKVKRYRFNNRRFE